MATARTFAALIDQDSVVVLEYKQEKAGFRVIGIRTDARRFSTVEAVVGSVVELLGASKAKRVSLSVVLQHFGSFFHTLILPPAPDDVIRPIILREVQRSFNITDPAIAYVVTGSVERRDAPRAEGQAPRQVLIAGAPKNVVTALRDGFRKARIAVEGITLIPEVFRQLYDALDGSTEATAVLVCLSNGPHVAFFVNGRLELAIDPPLALDGEAPLDSAVIVDQLERGSIFLRQQSRGTVATRLLLSAPAADYDSLASTIEARTGMHVAALGQGIGSPETLLAMGSVLAVREANGLDLYPRPASLDIRVRQALSGPSAVTTAMMALATIAALWCGIQVAGLARVSREVEHLQTLVKTSLPAVEALRHSAEGRERIAGIRATLASAQDDRRAGAELLAVLAATGPTGTQLDSFAVKRAEVGWKTEVYGRATGPTGPAAVTAATGFYRSLQQRRPKLKDLEFEINSYAAHAAVDPAMNAAPPAEVLLFTVKFVFPNPAGH